MKMMKITEIGNSTEEMGEEIQVATSDQIRINYSPFSVNLYGSAFGAAQEAIHNITDQAIQQSNLRLGMFLVHGAFITGGHVQVCHFILLFLDWYWSALLMNSSLYQFFRSGNVTSFDLGVFTLSRSILVNDLCKFSSRLACLFAHPIIVSFTFGCKNLVICVEAIPLIW